MKLEETFMSPPYYDQLAEWTEFVPESEIRRLLLTHVHYYFGGGKPGSLPIDTFKKILYQIADELEIDGLIVRFQTLPIESRKAFLARAKELMKS